MKTIEISIEEFKLIKAFYPDFSRAQGYSQTNKFFIDWNELMPVVEKIESLKFEVDICKDSCLIMNDLTGVSEPITNINLPYNKRFEYQASGTKDSKIECTYWAIIAFIKWYSALDGTKL